MRRQGFALMLVLIFTAIGITVLAGAMDWGRQSSQMVARANQYFTTLYAAEAATEIALAKMRKDYDQGGESLVYANISNYAACYPSNSVSISNSSFWTNFTFSDARGNNNGTFVVRTTYSPTNPVASFSYPGLFGFGSVYRIISNAKMLNTMFNMTNAVQQELEVLTIPLFQFAIFYTMDMELHALATMNVRGRVHTNGKIYTAPSAALTFFNDVSAGGTISMGRHPLDPTSSSGPWSSVTYTLGNTTNANSLSVPIGTNNTPAAVREILYKTPAGESTNSAMWKERYYNKAELLILVSNTSVTIGVKQSLSVSSNNIGWTNVAMTNVVGSPNGFLRTNATFTDGREGKVMLVTDIDVGKFTRWAATNLQVSNTLGRVGGTNNVPNILYVADHRTPSSSYKVAVRLTNGAALPGRGLTVATPNPVYVKGHYNAPTATEQAAGSTNTLNTKPASIVADAFTILSTGWTDPNSTASLGSRNAANTTINAAIVSGIVYTTNSPSRYSGGVHNMPRYLETWTGDTININGSMVVLFDSVKGTGVFQQPGTYYQPPTRNYNFDLNFNDPVKQPPGAPMLRVVGKQRWMNPPPNTTNYVQTTF